VTANSCRVTNWNLA